MKLADVAILSVLGLLAWSQWQEWQLNREDAIDIAYHGTPSPSLWQCALLTQRMTPAEMKQHLGVWQGCLATFGRFNRDPQGFVIGG